MVVGAGRAHEGDNDGEGMGDEEHVVRRLRREVEGSIHEIFEDELAHRAHFCNS